MSIIYKGLNPKNHYGLCILTINGELITADGKHFQAIQIDRPHGRLIDWDAFNNKLDIQYAEGRGKALAPTILEAEE